MNVLCKLVIETMDYAFIYQLMRDNHPQVLMNKIPSLSYTRRLCRYAFENKTI